jgi:hypothetical protein
LYINTVCGFIHEQVVHIQSLVKQHYDDNSGSLKLWRNIQRYVFFYAEGCPLALTPDGLFLEDNPMVNVSQATDNVNNTDVAKLLVNK